MMNRILIAPLLAACLLVNGLVDSSLAEQPLRAAIFKVDASPPLGSPLAYDPTREVQMPLEARGVVLLGSGKPVVLCAVDWIGIANGGYAAWRSALAKAAGTTPDRVAVHSLHQHDAPTCDFSTDALLATQGLDGKQYDTPFARRRDQPLRRGDHKQPQDGQPVTHVGLGKGKVEKVASNRRVIGSDGKIKYWRGSTTGNPQARAEPEGTIDPFVASISLHNGEKPLVVLNYYATHPMSYYRTGQANPDFVGMARAMREKKLGVPHIYFTGASGNVAAGKYNDGSKANRQIFADRLAAGMKLAWENIKKHPVSADDLGWNVAPVAIPPAPHLQEEALTKQFEDAEANLSARVLAARGLIWLRRCRQGDRVELSCLELGSARVVHMCGELFIEYQLAAQQMRSDLFVAMAAYGEYAPGYIGLEKSYPQGGYEVSARASRVAPKVEEVLMKAMAELLEAKR